MLKLPSFYCQIKGIDTPDRIGLVMVNYLGKKNNKPKKLESLNYSSNSILNSSSFRNQNTKRSVTGSSATFLTEPEFQQSLGKSNP